MEHGHPPRGEEPLLSMEEPLGTQQYLTIRPFKFGRYLLHISLEKLKSDQEIELV